MTPEGIKNLRLEKGMNQEEFAEFIGVSKRSIINYEQGETTPRGKTFAKLFQLIRYKKESKSETNVQNYAKETDAIWVNFNSFMLVPLVGQRAQAGFLSGYDDPEYLEELPKVPFEVDKEYKGKYLCFEVAGDSMDNNTPESLLQGDILLCREIQRHHWRNQLHINKWDFVIVHKEEGILVKRITKHDTQTGELTLHSLNEFYQDLTIQIDNLLALYNVVDIKRSRKR